MTYLTKSEGCSTCRFFSEGTSKAFPDADGMCRRYAPSGTIIGSHSSGWQIFPPMNHGQWCGDYRPDTASENGIRSLAA